MGPDKPEEPLLEWQREMVRQQDLDLEGPLSDEARQRQLLAVVVVLAAGVSVVAMLVVRAF
jgi:hypothetical protein